MRKFFRKHIALPQDHGSWVFILSPLLIGIFAGKTFTYATVSLFVAAMAAFMLRQPMSILVKAYAGRRSKDDLPAGRFWVATYGSIVLLSLLVLILGGFGSILLLAIPGVPIFAWHPWLVSRRAERGQAGVEIIATGVLSLAAPAAFWVGTGHYDATGWWLWLLTWLQTAASIVYAYLRLEQREQAKGLARSELWKMGKRALAYTSFNLILTIVLGLANLIPRFLFIPFLVQWLETIWGITHPATGWKPTRIGVRQLIVSSLWTILFIITYRFS